MRRYFIPMAVASLLLLVGCTTATPPATPPATEEPKAPVAQTVWTDTLSTKSYEDWKPAPGYETKQPAKGPHGESVEIFVDPTIEETLAQSGPTTWDSGSMIVKEAYDATGAMESVEYMQKTDEGWYFASFKPDGTVNKEGVEVAPCQPCHVKGSDSVMAFKLPQ